MTTLAGIAVRRVAVLHAHPDDETLVTGILLASLADTAVTTHVITATRGERGEVVPGPLSTLVGTPGLRAERERELERALTALGVDTHHYLGADADHEYRDSGMSWGPDGRATAAPDVEEEAFTRANPAVAAGDLVNLLGVIQPDVLVTYANDGGYGHPDHVRAHEIASLAASLLDLPLVVISDEADGTQRFDLAPVEARVRAALHAHATQLTLDGDTITHSGGQTQSIAAAEYFRVQPVTRLRRR